MRRDRIIDREQFLRAANEDYGALKRDPVAWQQELDERRIWAQADSDGLDPAESNLD